MNNDPRNMHIVGALGRLRDEIQVPPLDPHREQALLAAFDAHWAPRAHRPQGAHRTHRSQEAQPRRRVGRWAWTIATAASIAIAVTLDWLVVTRVPQTRVESPDPVGDVAEFVPWPGADGLPRFESGELVRVDLPVSSLPALGLWPPPSAGSVVQADIVVGQDGFARAVRLVQ
jgi:hypothetical protein